MAAARSGTTESASPEVPKQSRSVVEVARKLKGSVSAFDLARALLDTHDYAGRKRKTIKVGDALTHSKHLPVTGWLSEIEGLVKPPPDDVLDGRDVVFGASLLEPELFRRLSKSNGFLRALESEIRTRGTILSPEGQRKLSALRTPAEVVPTLRDDPATLDKLGREILAEVLAKRITRVRSYGPQWVPRYKVWWRSLRGRGSRSDGWEGEGKRCFLVHVDAPWGAGKTSLLSFLGKRLQEEGWVVVDFNAWEHQRIVPPWWWLMTTLHENGRRELATTNAPRAWLLLLYKAWWRLRDGWAIYLAVPIAVALAFFLYRQGFFGEGMKGAAEWAKSAGAVLTFGVAVLGALRGLNRWVIGGSEGAAASLLKRTRDPMALVKRRYQELVHAIRQPIAIFIDDLDRCKADYVVELLEGIQTMFATEPVVYVVAGEGNWTRDCYTQVYKEFCSQAAEPGRPLGWLFLEKTFQDTVPLPRISKETRESYWRGLLSERRVGGLADVEAHRDAAERMFEGKGTPAEIGQAMKEAQDEGRIDLKELQRAAALQLESEAVEEHTRHTLDNFGHLLEDNPRAMKKLVNAYGMQRDLLVLEDPKLLANELQLRQLALWKILGLRWPLLAEYLEDHPDIVDVIRSDGTVTLVDAAEGLDKLVRDPIVRSVIKGTGVQPHVWLDTAVVRRFAGLDAPPQISNAGGPSQEAPAEPSM